MNQEEHEQLEGVFGGYAKRLIRQIKPGSETVFDLEHELESGEKVNRRMHIGSRELQPEQPELAPLDRSPRHNHVFHDADSFLTFIGMRQTTGSSTIIADSRARVATAIMDVDSCEGGYETVTYEPSLNPLLENWMSGPWRAADFAKFVIENRNAIVEPSDAKEVAMLFRQIRTAKSVRIESGDGANSINGVMVEVVIGSGKDRKSSEMPMELPEDINIQLPLFLLDEEKKSLTFDLFVYSDSNDQVWVSATCAEIEAAVQSRFIESLRDTETEIPVTFGSYMTQLHDLIDV